MAFTPFISDKFRCEVESHLIGNLLIRDTQCPLILGIFGPPGEGKTFQVDEICRDLRIKQIVISPAELESPASSEQGNDPVAFLRKKYTEAGSPKGEMSAGFDMYMNKFHPFVLVINDVDTVLGDWGPKVEYTVRRQLLYGELMSLCDFPTVVARHTVKRVPIIMTGNDASILYRPLMRPGRMRLLRWVPEVEDKIQIITRIFPNIPEEELAKLVHMYPTKPVAFWKDINSRFQENLLLEWLRDKEKEELRKDLEFRKEYEMAELIRNANLPLESIHALAEDFSKQDLSKEVYV